MKAIFQLLLQDHAFPSILYIILLSMGTTHAVDGQLSGSGFKSNPYEIADYADLKQVDSNLTAYYILTNDIDASASLNENSGKGFAPIGGTKRPFKGWLDGKNFKITDLYINRPHQDTIGLFALLDSISNRDTTSHIANLTITGQITGKDYVGGIAGILNSTIYNVQNEARVNGERRVGGISGYSTKFTFKACINRGSIQGKEDIGGITGQNRSTILSSYNIGAIHGERTIGGITGFNDGLLELSYSTGTVTGKYSVGGIIGSNRGSVNRCYSTGPVEGYQSVGGLIGSNDASSGFPYNYIVEQSYSTARVHGHMDVGGLIGFTLGSIDNCYSSGYITGNVSIGGLVGTAWLDFYHATVTNNYWNRETSTLDSAVGSNPHGSTPLTATSLTTQGLKQLTSHFNWSLPIWKNPNNQTYPALNDATFNNAPFGFPDISPALTDPIDYSPFLNNDFDAEIPHVTLVKYDQYSKMIPEIDSIPNDVDSLYIFYRPGEITPSGDTLWGGSVHISMPFTQQEITISSYEELKRIGKHWRYPLNINYRLTQNIDASASHYENNGAGFDPIGTISRHFSGSFNGSGYVITNLYINRPTEDNVGLFSTLGETARIDSLGTEGTIIGNNYVGVYAGTSLGIISQSYSTGFVKGRNNIGGLTGSNQDTIRNAYSTAAVQGNYNIGGLVGVNGETTTRCYSTGKVIGISNLGGLIGADNSGSAPGRGNGSGYWNIETSGIDSSGGGTPLNTDRMKQLDPFIPWDRTTIWELHEGQSFPGLRGVNDAPIGFMDSVQSLNNPIDLSVFIQNDFDPDDTPVTKAIEIPYSSINETRDSLYRYYRPGEELTSGAILWGNWSSIAVPFIDTIIPIATYEDLKKIGNVSTHPLYGSYRLTQNIDATDSKTDNHGFGFSPIGYGTGGFSGYFNGAGNTISNLFINHKNEDYIGLFSAIDSAAHVDSLGLAVEITGKNFVGGFAGVNKGTIQYSHCKGSVISTAYTVGGIAGSNRGTISHSYNEAHIQEKSSHYSHATGGIAGLNYGIISYSSNKGIIEGQENTGGIAGRNYEKIIHTFNISPINGSEQVGGIAGLNDDTISYSFNTGSIKGGKRVGGIAGESHTILQSYNSGNVHGTSIVGGIVGDLDTEISNTYNTGTVSGNTTVGGLVGSGGLTIFQSYSTGVVWGKNTVGGLVGSTSISSPESYWNTETSNQTASALGTPLTTDQLRQQSSYSTWSFGSDWIIKSTQTYAGLLNINNAPMAFRDSIIALQTTPFNQVLQNDYDIESNGDSLVVHVDSLFGDMFIDSLHNISFIDDTPIGTVDSLRYRIGEELESGDTLWGNQAILVVTQGKNNPPNAHVITRYGYEDSLTSFTTNNLNSNRYDPDGDPLTFTLLNDSIPHHGTFVHQNDTLYYTPYKDWYGTDTLWYQLTDNSDSDTSVIEIYVRGRQDNPTITTAQMRTIPEDSTLTVTSAMTDAQDIDGDPFYLNVQSGDNYTVSYLTIIPDDNFNGILTVPLYVSRYSYKSPPIDMTIIVTPVNDPPTLISTRTQTIKEDSILTLLPSMVKIIDLEGDTIDKVIPSSGYRYTIDDNRVIPSNNYSGTLNVPVRAISGSDTSNTRYLSVFVIPVLYPPTLTHTTPQTIPLNSSLTVTLAMTDAQDQDRDAITLLLEPGEHYTINNQRVTPNQEYTGRLHVPVRAFAAGDTSAPVIMTIDVYSDTEQISSDDTDETLTSSADYNVPGISYVADTSSSFEIPPNSGNHGSSFQNTMTPSSGVLVSGTSAPLSSALTAITYTQSTSQFSSVKLINNIKRSSHLLAVPRNSKTFRLYSIRGALIQSGTVEKETLSLSSSLPKGVFIVSFE
ncbi:MAG: Ig-like domain-containing protein [Fibrobacterales bacterium]